MTVDESDRAFLARRNERKRIGLYWLPAALAILVLTWAAFYVSLPELISPVHAVGRFEGRPVEPGTVTKYAVTTALLLNLAFAQVAMLLVAALAWARSERRYLKLLSSPNAPQSGS